MGRIYQDIALEEDAKAQSIDLSRIAEKRRATSLVQQNYANASEMFFLAASHNKKDKHKQTDRDKDLWALAATSSSAAANHVRAAYCFKQMTQPGHLDTKLLLQLAKSYASAKDYRAALKQYQLLMKYLPDNIAVINGIVETYVETKSVNLAVQVLVDALEKLWVKWRKLKRGSRNFRIPPQPAMCRLTSSAERAIKAGSVPIIGDLHLPDDELEHRQETEKQLQILQRNMLGLGKSLAFLYHELKKYSDARATIEKLQTQLSLPLNSLPSEIAVLLGTCMLHINMEQDAFPRKLLSRRQECSPEQVIINFKSMLDTHGPKIKPYIGVDQRYGP